MKDESSNAVEDDLCECKYCLEKVPPKEKFGHEIFKCKVLENSGMNRSVREHGNATPCGLVWTANSVAYRCRTCRISHNMSLCPDCFQRGNHIHEGHDFRMFRSVAGGFCDCGDKRFMRESGFCQRHGTNNQIDKLEAPQDLLAVAEVLKPRLFLRLVQYLRDNSEPEKKIVHSIPRDVPNSMIDTENPKGVDMSFLDAKEKKIASCATQTDVLDSLIDTENPEDEDLSSLYAKDVTLLAERMKELLIKGSDHDVKIVVKDKEFRAHRIILRTRSPVFAMMLTHDSKESSTGTINIEDCDPDSFDEFLLYVYSGRTENLTPSKALQLYYTADKYCLPTLKKRCAILLKTSLSVTSICDVILLAAKHGEMGLLEAATEFFARNVREILETVRWQEFLSENPVEGNELYIKSMDILLPRK